ncbi:MAG TPA: phosphoglycerate kinase [Candidatus Aquiluna sp.]|mgnify:FL=1|jgi:phosphoglycerate kinase|nr:phosphoglycerate kinase [Aquiluna sp.]
MIRTLADAGDLRSKRVLLRCDLNVPLNDGVIGDDGRIRASLQTIQYLVEAGARVLIASHLGRPQGAPDSKYSLEPIARRLEELLGQPVLFCSDTVGPVAKAASKLLEDGGVALLENLRFHPEETSEDPAERQELATEIASFVDLTVCDGFGVVHREQASVFELAKTVPSYAGFLIQAELEVLQKLTSNPAEPYTVVLGGSKVSDKLAVIGNLLPVVNSLVIGGGMVFTVLAAQGYAVGKSLLETDQIETVKGFLKQAVELGVDIHLPVDIEIAESFKADAAHQTVSVADMEASELGSDVMGLDIGPESALQFAEVIRNSKTVFWNGPMGVFEFEAFSNGTRVVAAALAEVDGLSVVGGGDSAAAVRALGFPESSFGHISTGGGASLEYLEGKRLPGLEVLND